MMLSRYTLCITILLTVATNCLHAASVTLVAPTGRGSTGIELSAPITARGAEGLGSFQLDLVYDPAILQLQDVDEGKMLEGAMVAFNVIEPGRLRIAVAGNPRTPITGDGALLRVKFKLLGKEGTESSLKLENALAWEQTNEAFEMLVRIESGKIAIDRRVLTIPRWAIGAVVVGLIAVATIVFVLKQKSTASH